MAIPKSQVRLSLAEFLQMETDSDEKHEFHDGLVVAMAGASPEHVTIAGNLFAALHSKLQGKPCRPYTNDLRIWVRRRSKLLYPDLSVVCGPLDRPDNDPDRTLVCNPRVIVEVVSPSSKDYDRGEKLEYYACIDSFEEYVLVSQESAFVETLTRKAGVKAAPRDREFFVGLDATLRLETIGVEVSLRDIYTDISFPAPRSTR